MTYDSPNACAVVNPHLDDYVEFCDYAGVGVVFKVIQAIENGNQTYEELINKYGDLVAIGTIGDVVPLLGENRKFVIKGLEVMKKISRPGTVVLLESFDGKYKIFDSLFVSYSIVPKINSCGRTGSPEMAAKLFLAETYEEAVSINNFLTKENENRKVICDNVFNEVESEIKLNPKIRYNNLIFSQKENWNRGVLGIVASKIMIKYGKPSLLFSINEDEVRGSARSIPGFSIFDSVSYASEFVERFGGHPMAAGITLKKENLEKFKEMLIEYSKLNEVPNSCLNIDCMINVSDITVENVDKINRLKPFGASNLEPVFGITGVKLVNCYSISGGKYLRLSFSKNDELFYAMYFGINKENFFYSIGDVLDLAIYLRSNYYLGNKSVTVSIKNIKYSSIDSKDMMYHKRIFEKFMSGLPQPKEEILNMLPTRENIAVIYKSLKKYFIGINSIENIYKKNIKYNINLSKLYMILEILNELGIIQIEIDLDKYIIYPKGLSKKMDLEKSKHIINIKSKV